MRGTLSCLSALVVTGALLAGCEANSHVNQPRPPIVPVVSVSVSRDSLELAPRAIGIPGQRSISLDQNKDAPVSQAAPGRPLVVNFRYSNLIDRWANLVLEGPVDRIVSMPPNSPGAFTVGMKTGIYRLSSPGSGETRRLLVGPSRLSSAGDVLTP